MHLHEKLSLMRILKGLTQEKMAEKLNLSTTGYAKIERGETQLKIPRLEKIAAALEMKLEDILRFNEKTVFKGPFYDQSGSQNENFYVNSSKEMVHELETSRLLIEQQKREIELLKEQVSQLHEQISQLKQIIELMKK